jgi:hypothetical protein
MTAGINEETNLTNQKKNNLNVMTIHKAAINEKKIIIIAFGFKNECYQPK